MNHIDSETGRLLEAELNEIVERLQSESTIPETSLVGGDFLDVAQSVERQELNRLGVSRLSERARRLHIALGRLSTGEYGVCSECGEPIALKRLRALPEVTTCAACQAKLEGTARRN
jgi:phage/conjugal plasmid C-4 type zinc finger TraR family protein